MPKEVQVHDLFTIARSRADVFNAWRDPSLMTRYMPHLRSVTQLEGQTFRHVARNVEGGEDVIWDSEFVNDHTQSSLSWSSVDGAPVKHDGRLTLFEAPGNRGAVVGLSLRYEASDDDSSSKIASVIGKEPAKKVREEVRRFKQLMEAGEIPTVEGQPSGRETEETKG